MQAWFGRSVAYRVTNQTVWMPPCLRRPLHGELTANAIDLLEARSRLDLQLWTTLAGRSAGCPESETLRVRAVLCNVARHSALMALG